MFQRMPSFHGECRVIATRSEDSERVSDGVSERVSEGVGVDIIKVACKFECVESNSSSERDMEYHIQNGLITQIHHL